MRMSVIRTREELTPLEDLALIDASYSRLSTLDFCAAKWFYSYTIQEPRVFGAAASLGNVIHEALEQTDWDQELNLAELLQLYRECRPKYDPNNDIPNDLIDAGYQMLTEFVDRHKGEIFNVLAVEQPFHFILGTAAFSGYIDRISRNDNGILVITDWKTGKSEVAAKNIANDLQLGVYALAISQLYPDEEVIYAELYYIRSGHRKGHLFTKEDLAIVEQRLIERINGLIETDDFKFTPNKRICSFCDFKAICPVGKRRYPEN